MNWWFQFLKEKKQKLPISVYKTKNKNRDNTVVVGLQGTN